LSNAMAIPFERMEDMGENRVFVADANEMRFVAPMPGHLSRGGPHVQWLMLERGQDGYRLLFDHHQLNGYDPDNPQGQDKRPPVLVLEGLARARFEYRMLDENGELTDWSSSWEDPQRLPLMVRLAAEFDQDENREWPDLEIAVMAGSAIPMMFASRPGRPLRGEPNNDGRQQ